ncbi:MaoC family dehydratase [Shimia sp.]|uniref:MaoC family dehydratase n=1 Tax=Shimia sp. TaxID=1954381 RepID=UPI00356AB325
MAEQVSRLDLPGGLEAAPVAALADLLAALAGQVPRGGLPLIAPALLLGRPELAVVAKQMQPPEGCGVVHESQAFGRLATVPLDRALRIEARISDRSASRLFDFSLLDPRGDALGQMQTRLRFVAPQDMARFKGSRFPPHMDKGDILWRDSRAFGAEAVASYLDLAGDPNPIHVSDSAARAVGLAGAVVPGMLFAGVADPFVAEILSGMVLRAMKLRFMAPVPVGQGLRYGLLVRARDPQGRPLAIRVFILRADGMIAAIADIEAGH